MKGRNSLRLHRETMLLALREREGTVFSATMYAFAIGGAILAEPLMEKRFDVDMVKRKQFARLLDSTPIGDLVIDDCLSRIVGRQKRAQLSDWVASFARTRNLEHRAAEAVVMGSILRIDEDKEEPKPPSAIVEGLPRDVERVIARCLRKDPDRRYRHMKDLKVELEELRGESDSGRPSAPGVARRRRCHRQSQRDRARQSRHRSMPRAVSRRQDDPLHAA